MTRNVVVQRADQSTGADRGDMNRPMSLSRLINTSPKPSLPERTEVLDLESDEAGMMIEALGSEMARKMLSELYSEPLVASSLADRLDTSIQNVRYHLENLQEAELVTVADIRYSDAGREMKLYAPTSNAVLLLSTKSTKGRIRDLLSSLLAIGFLLGVVALTIRQYIATRYDTELELVQTSLDRADGSFLETDVTFRRTEPYHDLPFYLDPAIVFFLGGLTALCLFVGYRWLMNRQG